MLAAWAVSAALPLVACSFKIGGSDEEGGAAGAAGKGGAGGGTGNCKAGEEFFQGRCVDPTHRYEPKARIDFDNVVSYGEMPRSSCLPDPPKSGFRLVVEPQVLGPGEERSTCIAWGYPELVHRHVYAARLYVNTGLHHSNMFGMPLHPTLGASPYPGCNPQQADLFAHQNEILNGTIPDVLFANSTQVVGGEVLLFAPGMGFKLTTDGREVATTIHFLNPSTTEQRIEVVYDFFTMPADQVVNDLVPYYFDNFSFQVPPSSTQDVSLTCGPLAGGNLVSLMPHTHKRARAFTVDLIAEDGSEKRIYEGGDYDLESDIVVFAKPIAWTARSRFATPAGWRTSSRPRSSTALARTRCAPCSATCTRRKPRCWASRWAHPIAWPSTSAISVRLPKWAAANAAEPIDPRSRILNRITA